MHAHTSDGIEPWLPRFTNVLSQAGAALASQNAITIIIIIKDL